MVLNGANEVLVDLFLHGKIRFIDIQNFLIQMMEAHQTKRNLDLETILEEDMRGREDVRKLVEKYHITEEPYDDNLRHPYILPVDIRS